MLSGCSVSQGQVMTDERGRCKGRTRTVHEKEGEMMEVRDRGRKERRLSKKR